MTRARKWGGAPELPSSISTEDAISLRKHRLAYLKEVRDMKERNRIDLGCHSSLGEHTLCEQKTSQ